MGNAYLYYYPERDGGLEALDLGEGLGFLDDRSEPNASTTRGLGGQVFPSALGRFDRVRIGRDGITSYATVAALRSFEAYADARAPFAASADHAKTWAGYCSRVRLRGETGIPTSGNAFASLASAGTIAANDYVVIESGYPEWHWEIAKVSSYSTNTITLSAGLKRSYRETPILVRWYRFWPFLVLANGSGGLVTPTGPAAWDLAIDAETIAAANPSAFQLSQVLESGTGSTKGGGKGTLNDLISRQARDDGLASPGKSTDGFASGRRR